MIVTVALGAAVPEMLRAVDSKASSTRFSRLLVTVGVFGLDLTVISTSSVDPSWCVKVVATTLVVPAATAVCGSLATTDCLVATVTPVASCSFVGVAPAAMTTFWVVGAVCSGIE